MDNITEYNKTNINLKLKIIKYLKTNSIKIIKINNKTYLPYQLHQLPKWFNKYNIDYFNLKGFCYIELNEHYSNNNNFNFNKFKDTLSNNKDLNYKQKR